MKSQHIDADELVWNLELEMHARLFRKTRAATVPKTVLELANMICDDQQIVEEGGTPYRCIASYRRICAEVERDSPGAGAALTPASDLRLHLGSKPRQAWTALCKDLGLKAPWSYVSSGAGLLFVFLFALQCVALPLVFNIWMPSMGLSLLLSVLETLAISLFSPWAIRRVPGHVITAGDLACYSALRTRPNATRWTRSDVRLLVRYLVAKDLGVSIREVKMRSAIELW